MLWIPKHVGPERSKVRLLTGETILPSIVNVLFYRF